MPTNTKVYFENLNAIRFIAALLVIMHHIEQQKFFFNLPNMWHNGVVRIIGSLGVVLFFVLSGFLITYLLFVEQKVTNTINIKKFYIRRALRIWPLYFFLITAAFFVLPHIPFLTIPGFDKDVVSQNFVVKIILYVVFLPNMALSLFGGIPYATQTWSIGAEEQFYLVWPVLNKYIKNKWLIMFTVIGFYILIKLIIKLLRHHFSLGVLEKFWDSVPIDCMAIGGVFALILFENSKRVLYIRQLLFSKITQYSVLGAVLLFIVLGLFIPFFQYEFYAILFGILIINFAANKDRIFSMENRLTNFLGKISYGLYMYHLIAITLAIKLSQYLGFSNYIIYPVAFIGAITLASASYYLFEVKFINWKKKFSPIISGESAKPLKSENL